MAGILRACGVIRWKRSHSRAASQRVRPLTRKSAMISRLRWGLRLVGAAT